jgi:hypothetical protein
LRADAGQPLANGFESDDSSVRISTDIIRHRWPEYLTDHLSKGRGEFGLDAGRREAGMEATKELKPACPGVFEQVATRHHVPPHRQWEPEIRRGANLFSEEAGRRHPDDGDRHASYSNSSVEDRGISSESAQPEPMTEDGNWVLARQAIVLAGKDSAKRRLNTKS